MACPASLSAWPSVTTNRCWTLVFYWGLVDMSCPYKYALGVPGQGVHEARFLGIALNDTLMTIALAAIIAYFSGANIWITFLVLFVLALLKEQ